jgi:hypothetical protein
VLAIPTREQVERTYRSIELDIKARRFAHRSLNGLVDWNLPERRLAEFARREGLEVRLLLAPLRAAAEADTFVYSQDAHLGPTGHRIAAETVVEWLVHAPHEPDDVAGTPARRLRPASETSGPIDFRTDDHRDHLGAGWIVWRAYREGEPWGWWTAPRVQIALPSREGSLVLKGWLPQEAHVPVDLRLWGAETERARIDTPGDFEVRIPIRSRPPESSEGYVAVRWDAGQTHVHGRVPIGLIVHSIGFEADASQR